MSTRALSLVVGEGTSKALLKSTERLLSKIGITTAITQRAEANAVVVGSTPPEGVLAAVVEPHPQATHPIYSSIKTTVIRSILPRRPPGSMQLRDSLDIFPSAGIDPSAECESAVQAISKAALIAVEKAKQHGVTTVSIVTKPATKFQRLNELFIETVTETLHKAGITYEMLPSSRAINEMLLFPEKLDVLLINDDPVCENIQLAFASAIGGACSTYYTIDGKELSGGHSIVPVTRAVVKELKALGMDEEAKKVESSLSS